MATFRGGGEPQLGRDDDARLARDVRRMLEDNLELQMHPIEVSACEGVVELRGTVPDAELRQFAEQLALAAEGVRVVINRINVGDQRA